MKRIGTWEVSLPDESHVWAGDDMSVGEALMVEAEYGKPYGQWLIALSDDDVTALQVLVWFLRHKAGRKMARIDVDFPVRQLDLTYRPDVDQDDQDEDADPESSAGSGLSSPTSPPGGASELSEPATSSTSSTGTESGPTNSTS